MSSLSTTELLGHVDQSRSASRLITAPHPDAVALDAGIELAAVLVLKDEALTAYLDARMAGKRPSRLNALARVLPILGWLPDYEPAWLRADVIAGLTLWGLLVPEAIAYAATAGAPHEAGLYTLLGSLVVYAILGTSRQFVSAATSASSIMMAAAVTPFVVTKPANIGNCWSDREAPGRLLLRARRRSRGVGGGDVLTSPSRASTPRKRPPGGVHPGGRLHRRSGRCGEANAGRIALSPQQPSPGQCPARSFQSGSSTILFGL
jgi:hypothetical protein